MSCNTSHSCVLSFPQDLRNCNQWLLWKAVNKPDRDKPVKLPVDVSGETIDATTANMRFPTVCEAMAAHPERFSGIGFSFQEGDPFCGYDLDGVLNDNGEITDAEIAEEIRRLNSYTEVSPSGCGLHIIFKGTRMPEMKPGKRRGCRELYFHSRYFTITGDLWKDSTPEIREIEPALLKEIYQKVDPPKDIPVRPQNRRRDTQTALSDREIIDRIRDKADTRRLYNGDISPYPSASEATLALLNHLAFYTQDRSQVDQIFRRSGLMRPKYDEHRGGTTWGALQIDKALSDITNTYDPFYSRRDDIKRGKAIADRLMSRRRRPCRN
ncbi:MAG: hypothetical protein U9N40_05040 [Euryarchaeota archaeon]|nr:hypothetical protein [Euryarchaeota archaeon]